MVGWAGVVLAAGLGRRMGGLLPKPLVPFGRRPLVAWAVSALRRAGAPRVVVVVPPAAGDRFREALGPSVELLPQPEPRGTAHALLCASPALEGVEEVVVLPADAPLVTPATVRALRDLRRRGAVAVFATACGIPTEGLGRVVRDREGRPLRIVEASDAAGEAEGIREVNSGFWCLHWPSVEPLLRRLAPAPNGEYRLTDLVEALYRQGMGSEALPLEDPWEGYGVDSRARLAEAYRALQERERRRLLRGGVVLPQPEAVYVDPEVEVGPETVLHPGTHLLGETRVGPFCEVGPYTLLIDARLGEGCRVLCSVVEGAVLGPRVRVGPFSHVRPGTVLEEGVRVGTCAEVKNTRMGPGSVANHFCYLGDARIGAGVNVGAGTVTCNFDGRSKHPTVVEEGAFIGSDTLLVAPVRVGREARTGAGAVVTRDVPPGETVVGVPARPLRRTEGPGDRAGDGEG